MMCEFIFFFLNVIVFNIYYFNIFEVGVRIEALRFISITEADQNYTKYKNTHYAMTQRMDNIKSEQ